MAVCSTLELKLETGALQEMCHTLQEQTTAIRFEDVPILGFFVKAFDKSKGGEQLVL